MKILFATPAPPLLTKPRPYHFIRGLGRRGHDVHLLTQVPSGATAEDLAKAPGWREVVEACASVDFVTVPKARSYLQCAASLPTRTPLRVAYCRSPRFAATARELARRYGCDLVHVDRKRIAPAFEGLDLPKVLDATDSISLYLRGTLRYGSLPERAISVAELLKIPRFERRVCAPFSACLATTAEDLRVLEAGGCPATSFEVLPNGVEVRPPRNVERDPDSLLFVGTMHDPPNVDAASWLAKRVFPLVRTRRPEAVLHLVGAGPNRAVRSLGKLPGVRVTGAVPQVTPYLERCGVFVAPMRIGGGFPNKVAEALAAGTPTVATPAAFAGIPGLVPGEHLLEARTPREFADRTVRVLEDPALGERLGGSGRRFVQEEYNWYDVLTHLEEIYASSREAWSRARGRRRPT